MFFKSGAYKNITDLVIACQRQDRRAQNIFFERYKGKMLGVCKRYARTLSEGDDIFQEAFIKIFKNIHELDEPELVDRWVKTIVIRTAITYYNRITVKQKLEIPFEDAGQAFDSDDFQRIISQMDLETMLKVINGLPNGYRTIINMYLIDGYTHAEIAQLLDIEESTSKSQLSRGKQLLIKRLVQQRIIEHE